MQRCASFKRIRVKNNIYNKLELKLIVFNLLYN